jgi:hypothetical protein
MHFHHVLDCDSLIFNFIFLQYFKALSHGIRLNSDQIKGKKIEDEILKRCMKTLKKKKELHHK